MYTSDEGKDNVSTYYCEETLQKAIQKIYLQHSYYRSRYKYPNYLDQISKGDKNTVFVVDEKNIKTKNSSRFLYITLYWYM